MQPLTPEPLKMQPLEQIAVALDTNDWEEFSSWCELFGPRVGVLKVGLEAYLNWGKRSVDLALEHAPAVFLDVKLHDIPNTVAGAVKAVRALGVRYVTVHAGGGRRMMEAAAEAAQGDVCVLGVTVLTHLDQSELAELNWPGEASARVLDWAQLAQSSGLGGVVCSPLEVQAVRKATGDNFALVTPGVRLASGAPAGDDQRRVATPDAAIQSGASLLVVGRPLTRASDQEAALQAFAEALS